MASKKLTLRLYTSDAPALLRAGDKSVTLRRNDQFAVDKEGGRTVVVVRGGAYPVRPSLVPELKRRSAPSKAESRYQSNSQWINTHGPDIESLLRRKLPALVKTLGTEDLDSGMSLDSVWAKFSTSAYSLPVRGQVVFTVTPSVIQAGLYLPTNVNIASWEGLPIVEKVFKKFVIFLRDTHGIEVGKYRKSSTRYANVTVAGTPFTGTAYVFGAQWSAPTLEHSKSSYGGKMELAPTLPLPAKATPFPNAALAALESRYRAQLGDLARKIRGSYADPDDRKEYEEEEDLVKAKHAQVAKMRKLASHKDAHGNEKPSTQYESQLNEAKRLYLQFVSEFPNG